MFSFNRGALATDAPWNARVASPDVTQAPAKVAGFDASHPIAQRAVMPAGQGGGESTPTITPALNAASVAARTIFYRKQMASDTVDYEDGLPPVGLHMRILPILRRAPVAIPASPPPPPSTQPPNGGQGGTGSTGTTTPVQGAQPPPDPGQVLLGGTGDTNEGAGGGGIGTSIAIPSPVVVPNSNTNSGSLIIVGIIASVIGAAIWYFLKHKHGHEQHASAE